MSDAHGNSIAFARCAEEQLAADLGLDSPLAIDQAAGDGRGENQVRD